MNAFIRIKFSGWSVILDFEFLLTLNLTGVEYLHFGSHFYLLHSPSCYVNDLKFTQLTEKYKKSVRFVASR
jgi:hypothetical protein